MRAPWVHAALSMLEVTTDARKEDSDARQELQAAMNTSNMKLQEAQARLEVLEKKNKELETKSLTQQHIHYMQTSMEKLQVQPGFYEVMACNVVSLCPAPLLSPLGAGLHLPSFANCGRRRMTSLV